MSYQKVYKGHYTYHNDSVGETKIYSKKGLALNNTPEHPNWGVKQGSVIIEYELRPTGRKFNKNGDLIET